MTFDPTQPSSTSGTLAAALTGTNSNLNDLNTRLAVIEGLSVATTQSEIVTARGVQANLNARLSVAMDTTGNITELVTARGNKASLSAYLLQSLDVNGNFNATTLSNLTWLASYDTPTYVSANSFTVTGNLVSKYVTGLSLQTVCGTTTTYSVVSTSSYNSGTGLTTVTIKDSNLIVTLSTVSLGVARGLAGSTWYNTSGAPGSGVGTIGDYAVDTTTGNVYQKSSGGWGSAICNITALAAAQATTWTAKQTFSGAALDEAQGSDIASASTINLETATGNYIHVTGTTTITAITLSQGAERTVVFDGSLLLTNGASLILPTGSNLQTAAGDSAQFRGEAAGVVRCIEYQPAHGANISAAAAFVQNRWFS